MVVVVGQIVRHPKKPEWGVGEVLKIDDEKILVHFKQGGQRLLKGISLVKVPPTNRTNRQRKGSKAATVKKVPKRTRKRPKPKDKVESQKDSSRSIETRDRSIDQEFETILKILDRLHQDLGPDSEPNTALLLYTLLQTPGMTAHDYLGTLEPEVRAHLVVEALAGAQGRHFGIPSEHIVYAARRIAKEICNDSRIDSRHLLLVCMVGSAWLGRGPELPILSTESKHILGYSNLAVRAMRFAGIDPVCVFRRIVSTHSGSL